MTRTNPAAASLMLTMASIATATAAPPIYIALPGQIIRLDDRNHDDDYLDAFESVLFADDLPTSVGAVAACEDRLWVLAPSTATIIRIEDRNGDGDALDAGERATFAAVTTDAPLASPSLRGLGLSIDKELLVADDANGILFRVADLNNDGDALDFAEVSAIAMALNQPIAVAPRLDGSILVLQQFAASPLRILRDLNEDGDCLDFAENLPYVESLPSGTDICVGADGRACIAQGPLGVATLLVDTNDDGDCLDTNESRLFAENLLQPASIVIDASSSDVYVALNDSAGAIVRLRDLNADGDALDVGEALPVAVGLAQSIDMAIPSQSTNCTLGDANGDGSVDLDDLSTFSLALLNGPGSTTTCPIDMNNDGRLDGRDIHPFVSAISQ